MADDWRLTVDFDDEHDGVQLVERLDARRFEREERRRLGARVVVSRDAGRVFFYTGSEAGAREVEALVRSDAEAEGKPVEVRLDRWHPEAEEWRDAALPLPRSAAEHEAERDRRDVRETAASLEAGAAEWEVRIELPSHEETVALAERLEREGIPVVRRHTYVLVGAASEDDAKTLAARLRSEAPAAATVQVQPGGEMVWEISPQNPFVFIGGGLGG